jgi:hypothetical protein
MAKRPVFVPASRPDELFHQVPVEFNWNSGFAPSQKKKNIDAMHAAAQLCGLDPLLEVSTKSEDALGQRLSAFNLRLKTSIGDLSIESAYQGSKVFEFGGPFTDLYVRESRDAKKDPRLQCSGVLVGFIFMGEKWPLTPVNAFYDWLYLNALRPHKEFLTRLFRYSGFTDVEFNPDRSINCQARTCAILVTLLKREMFEDALESKERYLELMSSFPPPQVSVIGFSQRGLSL